MKNRYGRTMLMLVMGVAVVIVIALIITKVMNQQEEERHNMVSAYQRLSAYADEFNALTLQMADCESWQQAFTGLRELNEKAVADSAQIIVPVAITEPDPLLRHLVPVNKQWAELQTAVFNVQKESALMGKSCLALDKLSELLAETNAVAERMAYHAGRDQTGSGDMESVSLLLERLAWMEDDDAAMRATVLSGGMHKAESVATGWMFISRHAAGIQRGNLAMNIRKAENPDVRAEAGLIVDYGKTAHDIVLDNILSLQGVDVLERIRSLATQAQTLKQKNAELQQFAAQR